MMDLRGRRPETPVEFRDKLPRRASAKARRRHRKIAAERARIATDIDNGKYPTSDDFEPLWKGCKEVLSEAQYHKCAYCESRVGAGYPGDVEHFRPKAMVVELREKRRGEVQRGKKSKSGYWWLALSFDNFLFSCFSCNNKKGNLFPLRGIRPTMTPGSERREHPYLINPYDADPSRHLQFDELGGVRGATKTGRFTVYACGLKRGSLTRERRKVAATLARDIDDWEDALADDNELAQGQTLRRLLDACRPEAPYAAMARSILKRRTGLSYRELLEAEDAGLL